MPVKLTMPKVTGIVNEMKVLKWYKSEGERVVSGEPLLEVETEKVTTEVPSPASGRLHKILVHEGDEANVGTELAIIALDGESLEGSGPAEGEARQEEQVPPQPRPQLGARAPQRVLASPAARVLAKEKGIDLSVIKGSGPNGLVSETDVRNHLQGGKPSAEQVVQLSRVRSVTAKHVARSHSEIPPVTLMVESDVTNLMSSMDKKAEEGGQKMTLLSFLIRAAALVLRKDPALNATFTGDGIQVHGEVNIGVAVATEEGLLVPVVKGADKRSLLETADEVERMTKSARAGTLSADDVSGGTFTITNLGSFGVTYFTPIINHPESAILGVGVVAEKLVVEDGAIRIRKVLPLSLTFDHRVVDGVPAACFLQRLGELLKAEELLRG